MKKILAIILCACLLSASGCSFIPNKKTEDPTAEITESSDGKSDESTEQSDGDGSAADEDLMTFEVTLPKAFVVGNPTQEELDKIASEKGFISATLNDDGSVTYKMTGAKRKEYVKEIADGYDKAFKEMVDSKEYPKIKSIEHNDDFTDFTIGYDGDALGMDSFTAMVFYFAGGVYGYVTGKPADNVHVKYVNSSTGAVIQESDSKDLENPLGNAIPDLKDLGGSLGIQG